jgi:hypothetical protein
MPVKQFGTCTVVFINIDLQVLVNNVQSTHKMLLLHGSANLDFVLQVIKPWSVIVFHEWHIVVL